jgi:hypothetical protein
MNSLPNFEVDLHRSSIDLSGLESFLESPVTEEPVAEETETQVILRLLEQLYRVGELVKDTSQRLTEAHERLNSLTALVSLQNKQMEILSHYQAQAARAAGLEHSLALALAENEKLKRSMWRKIFFWIK